MLLFLLLLLLRLRNITITRKPQDRFCSNVHRLIISMLSTYAQSFPEFKIVVKDIFDFLKRFELTIFLHAFHNSKTLRWILLKLSENKCCCTFYSFPRPRSKAEMVQILTSKFYSANKSPGYLD